MWRTKQENTKYKSWGHGKPSPLGANFKKGLGLGTLTSNPGFLTEVLDIGRVSK
jgi:hypothetical protein